MARSGLIITPVLISLDRQVSILPGDEGGRQRGCRWFLGRGLTFF